MTTGAGDIVLALIAAGGGGGVLVKFVEGFFNRNKTKSDIAGDLRDELRTELTQIKVELKEAQSEIDTWKSKYYTLMEQFLKAEQKNALDTTAASVVQSKT